MNVAVIVATYGEPSWAELAYKRAVPSLDAAGGQGRDCEVIVRHEPDGTLAGVRNRAADHATADWLCFLDADDELARGYLAAMRTVMHRWNLRRPGDLRANPLLLAPALQTVDELGYESPPQLPNRHEPMAVLNHCVIGTLVPRRLFLDVGGFSEHPIYEDWALFLACVRAGATIVDVPDAVYRAHYRPSSRNVGASHGVYHRIRAEHLAEVLP